ncbi:MAG: hypothetical protein GY803_12720 [Chloroflexi bacterium]|nr:hypothetical protein [Chloroflexota bacterium]
MLSLAAGGGTAICLLAALLGTEQKSQAAGAIYCVAPPGGSVGPFAVCDQAFTSIQAAADTAVGGEEIRIATGVYTDVHNRAGVSQIVYLDKDVMIRGGYEIPFDMPPNPTINPTLLNARGLGRGIYIVTGTTAVLDGLHVTGGDATGLGGGTLSGDDGGGIYGIGATVTVSNSVIFSNSAASAAFGRGGGLAFANSVLTLTGNTIQGNMAGFVDGVGGGLFIADSAFYLANNGILSNTAAITSNGMNIMGFGGGLALSNSGGQLRDNVIESNTALEYGGWGWGGGIYAGYYDAPTQTTLLFDGNRIQNNVALAQPSPGEVDSVGQGGGIMLNNGWGEGNALIVTMTNNLILQNKAVITGEAGLVGGLYARNEVGAFTLTFQRNEVIGNVALAEGQGLDSNGIVGGLVTVNTVASLEGNRFISNTAVISGVIGAGGGVYFYLSQVEQQNDIVLNNVANLTGLGDGGGILFDQTTATLTNVVVADNQAFYGAGLWMVSSDVTLQHPTLARNSGGSAIYMKEPDSGMEHVPGMLTVTNAIMVSHTVGLEVRDENTAVINGVLWHETPVVVSQGPLAVVTLSNQVVGDPLFDADGYHINQNSAARGRGVSIGVTEDIDGEARPFPPALGVDEYWLVELFLPVVRR